jgi:hypothetical protein
MTMRIPVSSILVGVLHKVTGVDAFEGLHHRDVADDSPHVMHETKRLER